MFATLYQDIRHVHVMREQYRFFQHERNGFTGDVCRSNGTDLDHDRVVINDVNAACATYKSYFELATMDPGRCPSVESTQRRSKFACFGWRCVVFVVASCLCIALTSALAIFLLRPGKLKQVSIGTTF